MKIWTGHESATATALMSIFERAAAGASGLSDLERNFATACELWAAAASGELPNRFRANAASSLRDASEAFRHVGAHAAADALRRAADDAEKAATATERRVRLVAVAAQLVSGDDNIDALLAAYASRLPRRQRIAPAAREVAARGPFSGLTQ